ncbi:MAG: hypothetical protein ACYS99_00510 [Planctomycetota bacterium]|jgi:hypothetical protein
MSRVELSTDQVRAFFGFSGTGETEEILGPASVQSADPLPPIKATFKTELPRELEEGLPDSLGTRGLG